MKSHSLVYRDYESEWYSRWSKELKQYKGHLENHSLYANKFWQNAVMAEILWEHGLLTDGKRGLGFGVGEERLPALFAKHGVAITATDQDFTTQKAGYWSEQELATGVQSLNKLNICDAEAFNKLVAYRPADMKKIPRALQKAEYDFLWSNCALGHLGSIPAGLEFIENSLKCLKPGGWAVHTTELNILSNDETVTGGSTVIFRIKDVYELQKKLTDQGYVVSPFNLMMGAQKADKRISMWPQFGNDYSKIQVMGHLATQIVLIIQRPIKPRSKAALLRQKLAIEQAYQRNRLVLQNYRRYDPTLKLILKSQKASVKEIVVAPKRTVINVTIPKGQSKEVVVPYTNQSKIPLFSTFARLGNSNPIVLATTNHPDRASPFADSSWLGRNRNRLPPEFWQKKASKYVMADHVLPGEAFAFKATLNAADVPKGRYDEDVCIVQENAGWVEHSVVRLAVTVV
ncbi:MAG: hypothetical protein JWN38_711 [Candidatus Saccharibacteria bacterium]|nr:hypothetical protein [Candidatus Saccharibacteria bacterium]